MTKRTVVAVALALAAATIPMSTAEAAPAPLHCVNHVVGQRASGELVLSADRCYRTFAGAMEAEGATAWGDGASATAARSGVSAAMFTLAVHYDYANLNPAGGTTSTMGSDCTGGFTNVSPLWNNRISSTANGCPHVTHYDLINLGGASVTTTGAGGNLGTMNNRTGSIKYH